MSFMALAGWIVSIKQINFPAIQNETKSHEKLKLKREFSFFFADKNSASVKRTVTLITLRRGLFDPFVRDVERESEKSREQLNNCCQKWLKCILFKIRQWMQSLERDVLSNGLETSVLVYD